MIDWNAVRPSNKHNQRSAEVWHEKAPPALQERVEQLTGWQAVKVSQWDGWLPVITSIGGMSPGQSEQISQRIPKSLAGVLFRAYLWVKR